MQVRRMRPRSMRSISFKKQRMSGRRPFGLTLPSSMLLSNRDLWLATSRGPRFDPSLFPMWEKRPTTWKCHRYPCVNSVWMFAASQPQLFTST